MGATLFMAAALVVLNRSYLAPYGSAAGQLALALVGGCFAGAFAWLARLARPAERDRVLDPERTFTLRFADGNWVWIFALSAEDGHTRLISRNRIAAAGAWPARLFGMLVMEPGSLIMERKMLLGIKERAENLARE